MKGLQVLIFSVVLGLCNCQVGKVKEISIRPTKPGSDLPVNQLAKQCGGTGSLVQQRNVLCADPECKVKPEQMGEGKDITLESEFIPSKDIKQLGYKMTFKHNGNENIVHDDLVPGSFVVTGSSYTIRVVLEAPQGVKGRVTGIYQVYDFADKAKYVDICVEVQFDFA